MADLIRGRLPPPVPGAVGLAPGRSGSGVRTWFAQQSPAFRAGIELVAIDPVGAVCPWDQGCAAACPDRGELASHATGPTTCSPRSASVWPARIMAAVRQGQLSIGAQPDVTDRR